LLRCSVYIATSLDGFIARKDGDIDWLPKPSHDEDYGYAEFMKTVDVLVVGRNTFELVRSFGGEWPYAQPVVVLTSRPESLPQPLPPRVRARSGAPDEIVAELERNDAKHVYVDGGVTIQRFLRAGRIDRLIVTTIPVLIGSGLPLFGALAGDVRLKHVRTRVFPNGLVQSEYVRHRSAP
jgi:dihydrofolate reductase